MARNDMFVVINDKVELFREKGPTYKTVIGDVLDSGEFLAVVPSRMGVKMLVREKDTLFLAFYRESGRFVIETRVTSLSEDGNISYVTLEQIGKPKREQRRAFYRLPISLKAEICPYPETVREYTPISNDDFEDEVLETARTVNVSVSGLSIKTKRAMAVGEKYLLKLQLNWPKENSPPYIICGEVKRVIFEREREMYQSGLRFIDHNDVMSEYLAKFVLLQQQKMIQRKRFIEGD